jgi:hypothetical protein
MPDKKFCERKLNLHFFTFTRLFSQIPVSKMYYRRNTIVHDLKVAMVIK